MGVDAVVQVGVCVYADADDDVDVVVDSVVGVDVRAGIDLRVEVRVM